MKKKPSISTPATTTESKFSFIVRSLWRLYRQNSQKLHTQSAFKKNGESLKSFDLERLSTRVTGDVAITTYRVRATYLNKSGSERTATSRIIHTWLRSTEGTWRIISGMSALADSTGH